jgi:hypothetical protein
VTASELGGGWRERIRGKEGGRFWLATTRRGRGVQAAGSDAAMAGSAMVRGAWCCAVWKKKGKALGHPGKERKDGEGGVQPSDTAKRTRGTQQPEVGAQSAHGGEGSDGVRAGKKAGERQRERGRSGFRVGPAGRERRQTGRCGWPA